MKLAETAMRIEALETAILEVVVKIGNNFQMEAKNIQEKVEEVMKVHKTEKEIENKVASSQIQVLEEAKKVTATIRIKETVNLMGKNVGKRNKEYTGRDKNSACCHEIRSQPG